jgi:hypothetical protein
MNTQGWFTEISRTHLGITLACLVGTGTVSVYQWLMGKEKDICGSLMTAAAVSLTYPVLVPYSIYAGVLDWRNKTSTSFSASFKKRVTSNKKV